MKATMVLDTNSFYIKVLDENVFNRGLGLFSDAGFNEATPGDVQPGLNHLIRCLNLLYASTDSTVDTMK